jgi:uncharacterized membrane protein YbhN (UPF0104 family)
VDVSGAWIIIAIGAVILLVAVGLNALAVGALWQANLTGSPWWWAAGAAGAVVAIAADMAIAHTVWKLSQRVGEP